MSASKGGIMDHEANEVLLNTIDRSLKIEVYDLSGLMWLDEALQDKGWYLSLGYNPTKQRWWGCYRRPAENGWDFALEKGSHEAEARLKAARKALTWERDCRMCINQDGCIKPDGPCGNWEEK